MAPAYQFSNSELFKPELTGQPMQPHRPGPVLHPHLRMETRIRSLLKALSWRVIASAITGSVVFCFTGKGWLSLAVGLADSLIKILAYFMHERIWTTIPFGLLGHPSRQIAVRELRARGARRGYRSESKRPELSW